MSTVKKNETKCEKCSNEATVYFASVSGKGKASRHKYCKKCAAEERIRAMPADSPQQHATSLIGMVQNQLNKAAADPAPGNETKAQAIKRLTKAMEAAISKEDYEKAAKIRDQIAEINKGNAPSASV